MLLLDPPSASDSVCLGQGLKTLHPWQSPSAIGPGPALWKSLIESVTIPPERSLLLFPQGIMACFLFFLFFFSFIFLIYCSDFCRTLMWISMACFLSSWLVYLLFWMTCKWRYTECTLLCLAVFHMCNDLRVSPGLLHVVYSYLLLSSVLSSEYSTVGLLILFRHICFSPSIGLSWIKFLWTFTCKSLFAVTHFHHSWVNT